MDAIISLSHFCESHGPCVILSTQKRDKEPLQSPHSLTVPWCDACQSIDLDMAMVSRKDKVCYVTTRTPIQQDLAFLLKQASVRSLSCEEESNKEGGSLYFGDSERGHVINNNFTLHDSLARGFHRKYSILILMKDKIHLLNLWPSLMDPIKRIISDLKSKAAKVNDFEQAQCSQRAVRQAHGTPNHHARSLPQLTGEPAVFAHLHMWFTWILSTETFVEKPFRAPSLNVDCSPLLLREFSKDMSDKVFQTACYCILTGITLEIENEELRKSFYSLLPTTFKTVNTGQKVKVTYSDEWKIEWAGHLPCKLPTLQTSIETALKNNNLPDEVLKPHIDSLILHWFNVAKSLNWVQKPDNELFLKLGIQKCDLPLLAYWTTHCRL